VTEQHFPDELGAAGSDPDPSDPPAADSLTTEALRLVSSVQDWARRSFPESADGHTGSDCQWCPLCQFVAVLRGERPEVTERVAEAGTAVVAALKSLIDAASTATAQPGQPRQPGQSGEPRVQRINLDDES
jgi:hypothetical protein